MLCVSMSWREVQQAAYLVFWRFCLCGKLVPDSLLSLLPQLVCFQLTILNQSLKTRPITQAVMYHLVPHISHIVLV
jgi:hypothetical protein